MRNFKLILNIRWITLKVGWEILGWRKEQQKLLLICWTFLSHFPLNYLGIHIRVNLRRLEIWKLVIHTFNTKLASWEHKMISCVVNSMLTSLTLFYASFFKILKEVVRNLTYLQNSFVSLRVNKKKENLLGEVG